MHAKPTHLLAPPNSFRRRFRPREWLACGRPDAIPLINVALLMFLFLMVQSAFVLQPGVVVRLPASPFTSGVPYGAMVVTISQEGMVFFNDERIPLAGLADAFARTAHDHPDATLIIEADGRVNHQKLVEVYNKAMQAGLKEIALATRVSATVEPPP